jgi:hypothetical protein
VFVLGAWEVVLEGVKRAGCVKYGVGVSVVTNIAWIVGLKGLGLGRIHRYLVDARVRLWRGIIDELTVYNYELRSTYLSRLCVVLVGFVLTSKLALNRGFISDSLPCADPSLKGNFNVTWRPGHHDP